MNLATSNADWGLVVNEHTEFENLCTITVTTKDSREDGLYMEIETRRLAAIAEAYGCTWSIQLDAERTGLEFLIC